VTERSDLTEQGYRRFRCRDCDKQFNERSDGVLNRASLPSDIIAFVVFCRLRSRMTLRDLSEIMLLRGFTISHESIRRWASKLLPVMGEALRKRRYGVGRISGQSGYADETYLQVHGRVLLYRAIDRDGNLIDTMLSATRDMKAARKFFRSARSVAGFVPERVTTDGHNSYPRAIRSTLGRNVRHRTSVHLNNRLEQDHRGTKDASDGCAASRSMRRQTDFAESMMNSATSSAADPVTISTFQQAADADTFSSAPASRWASCRSHNQKIQAARALQTARDVTEPHGQAHRRT
jgi:putative transposase